MSLCLPSFPICIEALAPQSTRAMPETTPLSNRRHPNVIPAVSCSFLYSFVETKCSALVAGFCAIERPAVLEESPVTQCPRTTSTGPLMCFVISEHTSSVYSCPAFRPHTSRLFMRSEMPWG
jgi:hypothetical protein